VAILGHDEVERGLPSFLVDFRNAMCAAWKAADLQQAIPTDSRRWWCHIVPRGLPGRQIIPGLPLDRRKPLLRSGFP